MEHESFEDDDVAARLNGTFVCVKVDKEERPDVDSVYMSVCQAMTGSGGWPLTILLTPEKKPFYAGTYLPKHTRRGHMGLMELLGEAENLWKNRRSRVENSADTIVEALRSPVAPAAPAEASDPFALPEEAFEQMARSFDARFGGFGRAPKFPMAHGLLFLMEYARLTQKEQAPDKRSVPSGTEPPSAYRVQSEIGMDMAEKTLRQMYLGGIFDHIGYGFSRYSTDDRWLVPHFEKMLYDNALLVWAYAEAYERTGRPLYRRVAEKTIDYVLRELTDEDGGFYCAQDADSDGEEGRYYVFVPEETLRVLGKAEGTAFNRRFDITKEGNFEGKSIPNLLYVNDDINTIETEDNDMDRLLPKLRAYRAGRAKLHKDDKILAAWNGLMITALARAYSALDRPEFLRTAERAAEFALNHLTEGPRVYTSYRDGKRTETGFLDDYAFLAMGLIALYRVTFRQPYLDKAEAFVNTALAEFWDEKDGGFFLYGSSGERLFMRPKECYDGAMPSGNSVMAHNLFYLARLLQSSDLEAQAQRQIRFVAMQAREAPQAHSFFLTVELASLYPAREIVCVLADEKDLAQVARKLPKDAIVRVLTGPDRAYPLKDGRTTYYVCERDRCLPPVNEL